MSIGATVGKAWGSMEDAAKAAAGRAKESVPRPVRERIDTELGIYIIKNVGTVFYFDPQVREYERQIKEEARAGNKEEAIEVAETLKGYIMYQMQHNRYYKSRMKELSRKIEARREMFEEKVGGMKGKRLLKWLEKRNRVDAEELMEEGDIE